MAKFEIFEKETCCSIIVTADSIERAESLAMEWMAEGEWGDDPCYIDFTITEINEDNEPLCDSEDYRYPHSPDNAPACIDGKDHSWESPLCFTGITDENGDPINWVVKGIQFKNTTVCSNCGKYRIWYSESSPGDFNPTPEFYEYEDADNDSLEWVKSLRED